MFLKFGLLWLCLSLGFGMTSLARAQTFEEGYQSYLRNQFPTAELQFRKALETAKTKEDKAFINKFIGICQFMRGDRKAAAATFYMAVQLDRNLSIDDEEVLEPSVVTFFQSIKSRVPLETAPNKPPAPATADQQSSASSAGTSKVTKPIKKKLVKKDSEDPPLSASSSSGFSWWYLLPFGAGQFANESYLLGTAVATVHGFFIYRNFALQNKIETQEGLVSSTNESPDFTDAQKLDFQISSSDYIEGLRKDQGLARAGFVGLWLVSGVQAYFSGRSLAKEMTPSTSPSSAPPGPPQAKLEPMLLPTKDGSMFVLRWTTPLP